LTQRICFEPIGVVRSPFKDPEGTPINPQGGRGVAGTVEVLPEHADGLRDLDGFSHITLVYHLHLSRGHRLLVRPFLDDVERGVFATRAPRRPNPIGVSTVRLVRVEGTTLHVEDLDIVDGTPVLDIKPYVPEFDDREGVRIGWLTGKAREARTARADRRFQRGDGP
jgi:tRNA-Thr(GGU) m(6)t(6)A37 methyltransferase TsaA